MARYRKRPIVIEAIKNNHNPEELAAFLQGSADRCLYRPELEIVVINTLEGVIEAYTGDWIIRGIAGEIYPCRPDIFERTYELVEE